MSESNSPSSNPDDFVERFLDASWRSDLNDDELEEQYRAYYGQGGEHVSDRYVPDWEPGPDDEYLKFLSDTMPGLEPPASNTSSVMKFFRRVLNFRRPM